MYLNVSILHIAIHPLEERGVIYFGTLHVILHVGTKEKRETCAQHNWSIVKLWGNVTNLSGVIHVLKVSNYESSLRKEDVKIQ